MTHLTGHTTDHPHTTALQVTPLRTTVDHIHTHPTDHQNIVPTTEDHAVPDHTPTRELEKSHLSWNKKVHIEEPPSDYHSLDDNSTDSEESVFELVEPSSSSDSNEQRGPPSNKPVSIALTMEFPTMTVHAGKHYKVLIDSGAAISLVRYPYVSKH